MHHHSLQDDISNENILALYDLGRRDGLTRFGAISIGKTSVGSLGSGNLDLSPDRLKRPSGYLAGHAVDTAAVMFIVAALILLLFTITYVPSIVLWLPRLAMS